ncbi:MAG: hypothetical protein H7Y22_12970 [Gemmatimonadaceae bacterium]|nr:hypothetical protein [Gloeobacterales cyanobacterium ES-bin-141]
MLNHVFVIVRIDARFARLGTFKSNTRPGVAVDMARCRTIRGLSILEVAVATALVGILVAASIPSVVSRVQNQNLQSLTNKLVESLAKTQTQAMRMATPWTFALNISGNCYAIYAGSDIVPPTGTGCAALPQLPRQVQIQTSGTNFLKPTTDYYTLTFDDLGFVPRVGVNGPQRLTFLNPDNGLQSQIFIDQLIGTIQKRCIYVSPTITGENCA